MTILRRVCFSLLFVTSAFWAQAYDEEAVAKEVRLARSAAPQAISEKAAVYVFVHGNYILSDKGSNGFTCLVLRDGDPSSRYPVCLDPEWTRCELPEYLKEAELRAAGMPDEKIEGELDRMRRNGSFPNPKRSGIAYMASPEMRGMYVVVKNGKIQPHVMIYAPGVTNSQIGVKDVNQARREHIPFAANEGKPNAHILCPIMTYADGTKYEE
jgi:hypothetical protein